MISRLDKENVRVYLACRILHRGAYVFLLGYISHTHRCIYNYYLEKLCENFPGWVGDRVAVQVAD